MFRIFKRLNQINGYEPVQTILLGEYAYLEELTPTNSKKKRKNISIFFEFYETNSAKIRVIGYEINIEFHVVQLPSSFDKDLRIKIKTKDFKEELIFYRNPFLAGIIGFSTKKALVFFNE